MIFRKKWLPVLGSCSLFLACASENTVIDGEQPLGVFHALTPCADCEGIDTYILLKKDSFVQVQHYLTNKEGQNLFIDSGKVASWNGEKKILCLEVEEKKDLGDKDKNSDLDSNAYAYWYASDSTLVHLDGEGKVVDGPMGEHYTYKRVSEPFDEILAKVTQQKETAEKPDTAEKK